MAGLGLSLKVTDHFLYPIVVAVSVITTFFTPYMIRLAEPTYKVIERCIPQSWIRFLDRYSSGSNTLHQRSTWHKLLKSLMRIVGTYTAVTLVLIFVWLQFISPIIIKNITGIKGAILSLILILLLISPMLRAIMMKKNHSIEFQELWNDNKYNRGPLVSLIILRIILCIGLVMLPVAQLLHIAIGIVLAIAATVIALVIFSKQLKKQSILMERRFFSNLRARELENERKSPINQRFANHLLERDLHLADFEVKQNSPSMGKTLKELNFRKKCNVNVVTIIRGTKRINIPGGEERLYPFDKLIVVGTDKDLNLFKLYIEERYKKAQTEIEETHSVNIEQFTVMENSKLIGRTIQESNIRDKFDCLVIGIEREETSIKNPLPSTTLEKGDIVWIVGEHQKVIQLNESENS
jgi:CPA2 family monovalent cation:H+ antiporter-2